jgi:UDPglucose--hexose-1-phosphate uridylyltransferase
VPELRNNIITGDWVVLAPERAKRPSDFITADTVKKQNRSSCPFCEESPEYKKRLKKFDTKNIWVIPNKFPAFLEEHSKEPIRSYKVEDDFYRGRPSTGGHDVVVIKDHDIDLPKFTKNIWVELLETIKCQFIIMVLKQELQSNTHTLRFSLQILFQILFQKKFTTLKNILKKMALVHFVILLNMNTISKKE